MKIAIATCQRLPEPDPDERVILEALRAKGFETNLLAWDDPSAPFVDHDLVVLRSTWNYYEEPALFLEWIAQTGSATKLLNPAHVVRTNVEKTYLRDLEARGVDIVPTAFAEKGDDLDRLLDERWWNVERIVIKPVVSAGSFRTKSFLPSERADARTFFTELTNERAVMVQPWMASVETYGERSLVWIAGDVTHAIRKTPRLSGNEEQVSGEMPVAPEERAFATKVLAPVAADLLYARVDVVNDNGTLRVMELELIEPSLFFMQCPRALEKFVDAIAARR